jgi:alpha,alpha-trehalase
MLRRALLALLLATTACASARQPAVDSLYHPARDLGVLFHDIQLAGIFEDSKTFADARPLRDPAAILLAYERQRARSDFDLHAFVQQHFELPAPAGGNFVSDTARSMEAHMAALWPVLTRSADQPDARSSLIPLPHAYVVPGGRFREIYYWDSYFTMLGLVESGRLELVRAMLDNFAHLLRTVGHVPNGNRTYYLSRSQPPFFAAMVGLYAAATDTAAVLPYLDALEREHAFWMSGERVVQLPNGARLNRYWDAQLEPRPESYRGDYQLAQTLPPEERAEFYRNVRATAESGWDFSSRWLRDPADLRTLETTALAPIDLNSLLAYSERLIGALRAFRNAQGDALVAARFRAAAMARRDALLAAAWDPRTGFFYDVRWQSGERVADRPTMAAVLPLYFGLATPEQGRAVVERLSREFLAPGGFVTTLIRSGQQWDAPNGWPPLVWMGIQAACRYGRPDVAETARQRWLGLIRQTYRSTGKMMEKYDVADLGRAAGGGEYPAQDGFGWTNGVALALSAAVQSCRAAA